LIVKKFQVGREVELVPFLVLPDDRSSPLVAQEPAAPGHFSNTDCWAA